MEAVQVPLFNYVFVDWNDSNFATGWHTKHHHTHSVPPILSGGWVTGVDEEGIEITGHLGSDGSRLNPLSIPWGGISDIKDVTEWVKLTIVEPLHSENARGNTTKPLKEMDVALSQK